MDNHNFTETAFLQRLIIEHTGGGKKKPGAFSTNLTFIYENKEKFRKRKIFLLEDKNKDNKGLTTDV